MTKVLKVEISDRAAGFAEDLQLPFAKGKSSKHSLDFHKQIRTEKELVYKLIISFALFRPNIDKTK